MSEFSKGFRRAPLMVTGEMGGEPLHDALESLHTPDDSMYSVYAGIDRAKAGAISIMALQPHIQEFGLIDSTVERFASVQTTERWLKQPGGKGMFTLEKHLEMPDDGTRTVGYGWTAPATNQNVPHGETVFGMRLGGEVRGKGMAAAFGHVMLAASAKLYDAKNIWLEVREKNVAALRTYQRLGFQEYDYQPDPYVRRRPRIEPQLGRRIFMILPNELLDELC